jgi:hypothetical protein
MNASVVEIFSSNEGWGKVGCQRQIRGPCRQVRYSGEVQNFEAREMKYKLLAKRLIDLYGWQLVHWPIPDEFVRYYAE